MMANRYSISSINNIGQQKIFFDANILIYLFWVSGSSRWENQYATLYTNLNKRNKKFVVDFIVISEFVNRAIKLEYNSYLSSNNLILSELKYKEYRNSEAGQDALKDIYMVVQDEILKNFEIIEKSYSKNDLILMCNVDNLDFSDKAIIKICNENQFILLTNDLDFKNENIDILSCHNTFKQDKISKS